MKRADRPEHFEPHIQGLRAIAVLLVVVFHIWPGRLTGGYIGVDVFFVISGFLITGQLARELAGTGRVRLGSFWAKRARRLLPAAILVILVSAVLCLTLLPISSLPMNVRELLASAFYVENWALVGSSTDYLAGGRESIAQHYWSLSVEEQFYLVWPLLLLGAVWLAARVARRRRRIAGEIDASGRAARGRSGLIWLVAVVGIASYVLSGVLTQLTGPPAYFTTYTRMWEFAVGGLLALLPALRPGSRWLSAIVGWAGVLIVLGSGWFLDRQTPFPGWIALLPVAGTAMAIAAARSDSWFLPARILALPPLAWIGGISYSLYLWHWPLIIAAPFIPGWPLQWWNRVILLVAAVLLAWLTRRFVEDPSRRWPRLVAAKARWTALASVALMAAAALVIGGVWFARAPQYRAEAAELAAVQADPPDCFGAAAFVEDCVWQGGDADPIPSWGFAGADEPSHPECLAQLNDATLRECEFGSSDPAAPRVALIGDSHAYQYLDTMIALADANGWSLTTYLKGACPWNALLLAEGGVFGAGCEEYQRRLGDALAATSTSGRPYDAIVTAAFSTTQFSSAEMEGVATAEQAAQGYADAWGFASAALSGQVPAVVPIVAIRDNPHFEEDPLKCLRSTGSADACAAAIEDAVVDPDPIALAAQQWSSPSTPYRAGELIDLTAFYCPDGWCPPVRNGATVYRDSDHLTATWVSTMAPILEAAVASALAR